MKRSALVLALLVFLLACLASSPGFGVAAKPSLRLLHLKPFVVGGRGFKSHERVTVLLQTRVRLTRRATASAAGAFTASFGRVAIKRCDGFRVHAIGNRGSRAIMKLPQPACLPVRRARSLGRGYG